MVVTDAHTPDSSLEQVSSNGNMQGSFVRQWRNHLGRKRFYFGFFLLANLVVWTVITLFYLSLKDSYTSQWTLIIPGSGEGHAVSLDSIGQASATKSSPFSHSSIDPSVNYKAIANSYPVLKSAADTLNLPVSAFGKAKIKVVTQTSLLQFTTKAASANLAQEKAHAHYQAIQTQLDRLRDDEQERVNASRLTTLDAFSEKLEAAQSSKLNYQTSTGIISLDQFHQLVSRLENEKDAINSIDTELAATKEKIQYFLKHLNINPTEIPLAISLRNDTLFQDYLVRHADIHTQIATMRGTWGKNHPQRMQLEAAHKELDRAIKQRGKYFSGTTLYDNKRLITLGSTRYDGNILIELVELRAKEVDLAKQLIKRKENLTALAQRIENKASDAIKLDDLSRKQQVAMAVFSTALAKQDIGKADRFASYPLLQLLSSPSLPENPDRLVHKLVILSGIFASIFIMIGCTLLWYRRNILQKILKKS